MIEKITPEHILGLDGLPTTIMPDSAKLMRKINELVDTVNILQAQVAILEEHAHPTAKTLVDPYAEQRKCICKLCWFWNDDKADKVIGILTGVFDEENKPFERNIDQTLYKHCEPVKPDSELIYHGE